MDSGSYKLMSHLLNFNILACLYENLHFHTPKVGLIRHRKYLNLDGIF